MDKVTGLGNLIMKTGLRFRSDRAVSPTQTVDSTCFHSDSETESSVAGTGGWGLVLDKNSSSLGRWEVSAFNAVELQTR